MMWRLPACAAAALLLASCFGPAAIDSVDAGRTKAYEPGVPNFDMEAVVRVEDHEPVVDVYYSISPASLVFVQIAGMYVSEYEVDVQLVDRESKRLVQEHSTSDTLHAARFDSTVTHEPLSRRLELGAPPGEYVVEMVLTDLKSGSRAVRRQAVHVEAAGSENPFVSRLLVEGIREDGTFEPVISLHMPSLLDSLRASIQLYNLSDRDDLVLTLDLVRFESDTTVATPPYWLVPSRASIAYRGVDYDRPDTIQVSRRPILSAGESAVVEFSLPQLTAGMYRLSITGADASGETILRRERTLSVKNPTFPSMTMLDDLVQALAHIAFRDEIEHIQEADTQAEKKRRFDAFWGSLVSNRNLAASLIKLYYGRVEEANLFFTGFKEGWKTDRGMIYTILGPPLYVDHRVDTEIWHYSYGDRDPVNTFEFEKVRAHEQAPFETYVLQRRPYYQHEWTRAVDRWRDGAVL